MRFLIIDDSPHDRELIKRTIQKVFPTATYVEVIHQQGFEDVLRELDYSIVFTDYRLKWTTGIEVLKAIRELSPELPVIMVTETGSEEIATEAMKMGLNDYVLKSHLSRLPLAVKECLERVKLQAEHRELQAQMQQAQKMESLGLLVSSIAHDFNNLLAVISGYAQRGMTSTQQDVSLFKEYFHHIHDRAEQGARITGQLLAFARGTSLNPVYLDLNERITMLLDLLQTLLGANIQLDFDADPALKVIYADPTQIEQALMNLCLNARDAMTMGGCLELSTQQIEIAPDQQHSQPYLPPGSYVLLCIKDTGVGMNEHVQARLFEPFFTTKEAGAGTGLGLAVVYGIVKQHHGVIRVQSQPGQGTTFWLYFPAVESALQVAEESISYENDLVEGGSETILLVEDDPDIQLVISEILEEYGYAVLIARDGEEGLYMLEQHALSIALVVADIMMPKMQGRYFQEHIRKLYADMKVLVISGYQECDLRRRDLLDPRSAFLQKPFSLDVFVGKIRELISRE